MREVNFPINSKIAGVSAKNEDGTKRQLLLSLLEEGDVLYLERDKYNPYDENAIEITNEGGEVLGYINRKLAETLSEVMDEGYILTCEVSEVTGGEEGRNLGCNILINATGEKETTWMDVVASVERSEEEPKGTKKKSRLTKILKIIWRTIMISGLVVIGLFILVVWYALKAG